MLLLLLLIVLHVPEAIESAVAKKIAEECQELCSAANDSILRQLSLHALASFSPKIVMTDTDQSGVVERVPEDERERWFFDALGDMVDTFVYTRFKSDLERLAGAVQEVMTGSARAGSSTSRKPRHKHKAHDLGQESLTGSAAYDHALQCHHPYCMERFQSAQERDRHESAAHCEYTITDHASATLDSKDSRTQDDDTEASVSVTADCADGVFSYASNLVAMALIERDFK